DDGILDVDRPGLVPDAAADEARLVAEDCRVEQRGRAALVVPDAARLVGVGDVAGDGAVGDVQGAALVPDRPGHAAAAGLVAGQGAVDDVDGAAVGVVDAAGAVGRVVRDGTVADGQRPGAGVLDGAAVLQRAKDGVGKRQAVERDVGGGDEEHAHVHPAADRQVLRPRAQDGQVL